jgi:hypothetical protein
VTPALTPAPVGEEDVPYYVTTAYYLAGTTGWAEFSSNSMIPAVLWNPSIQASGANFGVRNNQFGFNVTGPPNLTVVVEACTNMAGRIWSPVATNNLINGLSYFSDPQSAKYSGRFYRISSP